MSYDYEFWDNFFHWFLYKKDLKLICEYNELNVSGNKNDLVERILDYVDELSVESIASLFHRDDLMEFSKDVGKEFRVIAKKFYKVLLINSSKNDFPYFPPKNSIKNTINKILKLKKRTALIVNTIEEIRWWDYYFKNPEVLPENIQACRAFDQNLIVDILGNVKFCFNKMLEPSNRVGCPLCF
ncbi:MAG: SAP domain-containing protein [Candidatus Helarchaeota archaeon]